MQLGYLCGAPRISTRPDVGSCGPRAHVVGVMRAFETLGWGVKSFILGDRLPPKVVCNLEGFRTEPGGSLSRGKGLLRDFLGSLGRLATGLVNTRSAWKELGGQVDWVYERHTPLQSLGRVFQSHGIPWILEINDIPLPYEVSSARETSALLGLANRLEVSAYRQCDVLVCVSSVLKDLILQRVSVDPNKILVVPNGIDPSLFDPLRYSPQRIFSDFTVGFVGNLTLTQAGLDLLLRAIEDLRKEGLLIKVIVVGDGIARVRWESLTQSLNLAEQVRFVGQLAWDQVPGYIAGFDLGYSGQNPNSELMHLSPLKLYEYMAMAKPVLASAFEDARKLVEGRRTGFLFQPGNKEDLKHALRDAYRARDTLPEMGQLARQEIVGHHSWTARVREMVPPIEAILREKNG